MGLYVINSTILRISYEDCVVGRAKDIDGVTKRIKDQAGGLAQRAPCVGKRWAGKGAAPSSPVMQCTFVGKRVISHL